ncbi:MAG: hypothetical protein ACFFGZ_03515 [Candidatus Thorarchaeota archaeon]
MPQHKITLYGTNWAFQTSVTRIYAAGDCRKGASNQAIGAAWEGASATIMVRECLRTGREF